MDKGSRILVVDDDPQWLQLSSHLLTSAGYEVIEAPTGADGLRLAKEQRPDLILLDVYLPDINGLEVCRNVKSDEMLADSYVVFLSGQSLASDFQANGLELGADGFLSRPISNRELLARVEAVLRLQQANKELRRRTQELSERVKELNCLYGISNLFEKGGTSMEEVLQGTADLIPPGWPYPEVTCARVTLESQEFTAANYKDATPWRQTAVIKVHGQQSGVVEVCYLEPRSQTHEGPPLREEQSLLNEIAERLGRFVEQMRAEEELRKFQRAVEQGPGMVVVTDTRGRIEYVNPKFTLVSGYMSQEVLGQNPRILNSGKQSPEFYQDLWHTILSGEEWRGEFCNRKKDGQVFWELASISPVRNAEGTITNFVKAAEDITERKQVEEALELSEKKYRQLVELAQEGVWTIDAEANTTFVNPRMAEMLGYTVEEMEGAHLFSFIDEQYVELGKRNLERRRQGIKEQHDFALLRKDGTRIYTSMAVSPITDDEGNYSGALALVADITERRQAERAVQEERDRAQNYLDIAGAIIVVIHPDQTVALINRKGCEILEYAEEELLGRNWFDHCVPERDRDRVKATFEQLIAGEIEPAEYFENLILTKSGQERMIAWHNSSLLDKAGNIVGTLSSGEDITERQQAQNALRKAHDELELRVQERTVELDRANLALKEEMAERSRIARDLHDTLGQSLGYLHLKLDQLAHDDALRGLGAIPQELERMCGIANESYTLVRGTLADLKSSTSSDLAASLLHHARSVGDRAGIEVHLTTEGKPHTLFPLVLRQILYLFREAISNVEKHANAHKIDIKIDWKPDTLTITLADDGRGFRPKIIQPEGHYGLAIMRERAEEAGGQMAITSSPDSGTEVAFTMPLVRDPHKSEGEMG